MEGTFRLRRYYRNVGLAGFPAYLAWAAGVLYIAVTDPEVPDRLAAAAVMAGLPLFMCGVSVWLLLAYRRDALTFRADFVEKRGVIWSRAVDLREVTHADWRNSPRGGSIVLRNGAIRLVIYLMRYEFGERERIVDHLRSVLCPEAQTGWTEFAYKMDLEETLSVVRKPGPYEVLLHRARWDRPFGTAIVVAMLAGAGAWWATGLTRYFVVVMPLLLGWGLLRTMVPVNGIIDRKLSHPDTAGLLGFLTIWALVGAALAVTARILRPEQTELDAATVVGAITYFAILVFEVARQQRRLTGQERKAAEMAAKAPRAAMADPWEAS